MVFRTHAPSAPLSRFVDMLWFYSGTGPAHRMERVLPDGTAELVINLDEVPRKRFHRSDVRRFDTVRRAWISGPQPEFILIDVLPRATMIGVHFKPGGLAPFVRMPASELCSELVELELLWGRTATELREALLEAPGVGAKFRRLELALLEVMRHCKPPSLAVAASLRHFALSPAAAVENVARELGISHKHLIHRFRQEVGLTPKRFCRIQRFQRALGGMVSKPAVDWPDLACATGYYDQAHFIHDFRKFSGLTPRGYLQQPGADTRFVPVTH